MTSCNLIGVSSVISPEGLRWLSRAPKNHKALRELKSKEAEDLEWDRQKVVCIDKVPTPCCPWAKMVTGIDTHEHDPIQADFYIMVINRSKGEARTCIEIRHILKVQFC